MHLFRRIGCTSRANSTVPATARTGATHRSQTNTERMRNEQLIEEKGWKTVPPPIIPRKGTSSLEKVRQGELDLARRTGGSDPSGIHVLLHRAPRCRPPLSMVERIEQVGADINASRFLG